MPGMLGVLCHDGFRKSQGDVSKYDRIRTVVCARDELSLCYVWRVPSAKFYRFYSIIFTSISPECVCIAREEDDPRYTQSRCL